MSSRTPSARSVHGPRGGFTFIEVLMALTVLLIGTGGILSVLIATKNLGRVDREVASATEAAQGVLERLKATPFDLAFALWNDDPTDDPPGVGVAPGAHFAVTGLSPRRDDADGFVGRVVFPTVGGELREDVTDEALGLPRDLNLDLLVDSLDHSGDYALLPVHVRVEWAGSMGAVSVDLPLVLGDLDRP